MSKHSDFFSTARHEPLNFKLGYQKKLKYDILLTTFIYYDPCYMFLIINDESFGVFLETKPF
jgi:hypothetical protein